MPSSVELNGFTELEQQLIKFEAKAEGAVSYGLYKAAGIFADSIKEAIDKIQTEPFTFVNDRMRLPSPIEKAMLKRKGVFGIARFERNGNEVSTVVGISNEAGYAPLGNNEKVPIAKIAYSINSGTSFMIKQPFLRKGVTNAKKSASTVFEKAIEQYLEHNEMR